MAERPAEDSKREFMRASFGTLVERLGAPIVRKLFAHAEMSEAGTAARLDEEDGLTSIAVGQQPEEGVSFRLGAVGPALWVGCEDARQVLEAAEDQAAPEQE